MQIADNTVVAIDYTLTDDGGTVIDKSEGGGFAYLHGANNIIPGLEKALIGKGAGDELQVAISPQEAYGVRDEGLVQVVSRSMFPEPDQINVGSQFHGQSPDGGTIVVTVVEVEDDNVTIDGNHPLAGVNLNFDVKVVSVREATAEELEHGHVHGPGGHDHD